jgi:hypothetical protein
MIACCPYCWAERAPGALICPEGLAMWVAQDVTQVTTARRTAAATLCGSSPNAGEINDG